QLGDGHVAYIFDGPLQERSDELLDLVLSPVCLADELEEDLGPKLLLALPLDIDVDLQFVEDLGDQEHVIGDESSHSRPPQTAEVNSTLHGSVVLSVGS